MASPYDALFPTNPSMFPQPGLADPFADLERQQATPPLADLISPAEQQIPPEVMAPQEAEPVASPEIASPPDLAIDPDTGLLSPESVAPGAAPTPTPSAEPPPDLGLEPESSAPPLSPFEQRAQDRAQTQVDYTQARMDARDQYNREREAMRERTATQLAEREERTAKARADVEKRRAEIDRMEKDGEPAMTSGEKLIMLATFLAGLFDPNARRAAVASMQTMVKKKSSAFAERMARAERGLQRAQGVVSDSLAEERHVTEIARLKEADLYRDLSLELEDAAAKAENAQAQEQMRWAANDARAKQQAAEAQAMQAAEDRIYQTQEREGKLALQQQQLQKGAIDIRKAQAGPSAAQREMQRIKLEQAKVELASKVQALENAGKTKEAEELRDYGVRLPTGEYMVTNTKGEARDKLDKKIVGAQDLVEAIDDVVRLRKEHGSEWTTFAKTDAARQMASKLTSAKLAAKEFFDLGAITESDADLIDGLLGGDPTKFDSTISSLQTTRDSVVDQTNRTLRQKARKGAKVPRWSPQAPSKAKPSRLEFVARAKSAGPKSEDADTIISGLRNTIKSEYGSDNKGWVPDAYKQFYLMSQDESFPKPVRDAAGREAKKLEKRAERLDKQGKRSGVSEAVSTLFGEDTAAPDSIKSKLDKQIATRKRAVKGLREAAQWLAPDEIKAEYDRLVSAGDEASLRRALELSRPYGNPGATKALQEHEAAVNATNVQAR